MNNTESCEVLIKPLLTERSVLLKDKENRYSFEVSKTASKTDIKRAVEKLFNVKVKKVNTSIVIGKWRKMGKFEGQRPEWKKAVVALKQGYKIDVAELK